MMWNYSALRAGLARAEARRLDPPEPVSTWRVDDDCGWCAGTGVDWWSTLELCEECLGAGEVMREVERCREIPDEQKETIL